MVNFILEEFNNSFKRIDKEFWLTIHNSPYISRNFLSLQPRENRLVDSCFGKGRKVRTP